MEERQATPTLQEFTQLQRLAMFGSTNQVFIADFSPTCVHGTMRHRSRIRDSELTIVGFAMRQTGRS